jgi:hypothetical protein
MKSALLWRSALSELLTSTKHRLSIPENEVSLVEVDQLKNLLVT